MLLAVYIPIILQQTVKYSIIVQNVKPEYFHSGHKMMHREETATLATYLSDNLKIFTCLTPLDDQPIVLFKRVQDPCVPIQNNSSVDQQKRENFFNSRPGVAQQPRYKPLYSTAAKRYFATITLSPEELDSFRAFLPVIDNFYHFQLYVKNKQRARELQNQFNYGYKQNNREATAVTKRAANPSLETMGGQTSSSLLDIGSHLTCNTHAKKFLNLSSEEKLQFLEYESEKEVEKITTGT